MVNTETCLPWGLRLPPRMPWHYQMQWFTSRSGHWSKVLRGFMSITLALPSPRNTQSMRPSWKMRVGVGGLLQNCILEKICCKVLRNGFTRHFRDIVFSFFRTQRRLCIRKWKTHQRLNRILTGTSLDGHLYDTLCPWCQVASNIDLQGWCEIHVTW